MLETFVKYFLSELRTVSQAPLVFGLAIVVIGLVIWRLMEWGYGRENSLLRLQPVEQKAILETLRKVIGGHWTPLTDTEVSRMANALKALPKRRVQMMYENSLGKDLASSLRASFEEAGWEVAYFGRGGGLEAGICVGTGVGLPALVKEAIEKSTTLSVNLIRPHEQEDPRMNLLVSVGVNDR